MEESEKILVSRTIKFFEKYFHVKTEIRSKCKTGRVDLVLFQAPDIYFGVECKKVDKKTGEEIGEWIKQTIGYAKLLFEVQPNFFKQIPIFICPSLSYQYLIMNQKSMDINGKLWHSDRHDMNHNHHTVNGMLGVFGIGELRKRVFDTETYFVISFSNRLVWSGRKKFWENSDDVVGIETNNYNHWLKQIKAL